MPEAKRTAKRAAARAMWSGTITFGLVSIPVELYAAVQGRHTAMRMVDAEGNALGREYFCPKDGKTLSQDDLVHGIEPEKGAKMVVLTDEDMDSVAPEITRDIELRRFVPAKDIPGIYFDHPYFLAPSGRSAKAYFLLVETMEKAGQVGIGTFVMRGHQYLVAIISDKGFLRAETLRFGDEIKSPGSVRLPKVAKPSSAVEKRVLKVVESLRRSSLDLSDMNDECAEALEKLAESKKRSKKNVVELGKDDEEPSVKSADVIDLVAVLRQRLGAKEDKAVKSSPKRAAPAKKKAAKKVAKKAATKVATKVAKRARKA